MEERFSDYEKRSQEEINYKDYILDMRLRCSYFMSKYLTAQRSEK